MFLHGTQLAGLLYIPCCTPTSTLCYGMLLYSYLIYILYLAGQVSLLDTVQEDHFVGRISQQARFFVGLVP